MAHITEPCPHLLLLTQVGTMLSPFSPWVPHTELCQKPAMKGDTLEPGGGGRDGGAGSSGSCGAAGPRTEPGWGKRLQLSPAQAPSEGSAHLSVLGHCAGLHGIDLSGPSLSSKERQDAGATAHIQHNL